MQENKQPNDEQETVEYSIPGQLLSKGYKGVNATNDGLYHLKIEKPVYREGKKVSNPYVQIFNNVDAQQFVDNAKALGYVFEFVYIPKGGKELTPPKPKKK